MYSRFENAISITYIIIISVIMMMIIMIMIVFSEKSSREESRLLLDHKEEMEELHTDLNERDDKIEQLDEDLHVQLQVNNTSPYP